MDGGKGWGRAAGRAVLDQLLNHVEARPNQRVFRISMEGVEQMDASFASEALVELIRRYSGVKGFCLENLTDQGVLFNLDIVAKHSGVPIVVWKGKTAEVIGGQPSSGTRQALDFALTRPQARAAEFADAMKEEISIANASTKFRQLWEKGFLLRSESAADSGGVEFVYERIG